jgi:hypothetical protein
MEMESWISQAIDLFVLPRFPPVPGWGGKPGNYYQLTRFIMFFMMRLQIRFLQ